MSSSSPTAFRGGHSRRLPLLPDWLRTIAAADSERIAVSDPWTSLTYAELVALADDVGAGILASGIEPGDRVLLAMEPAVPYLLSFLGAAAAGVVPAPVNTRLAPPEVAAYARVVGGSVVVADQANAGLARACGTPVINVGPVNSPGPIRERMSALLPRRPRSASPAIDAAAPALIFPTGGTTGSPKAGFWEHAGLWQYLNAVASALPRRPDDIEVYASPFFHVTLGTGLLSVLLRGGTVVILPRFEPGAVLASVHRGGTRIMAAPSMLQALAAHPDFAATDRSRVTCVMTGASAVSAELSRALLRDYPAAELCRAYGATEFPWVVQSFGRAEFRDRPDGLGRPIPGARVRLLGPDGAEVPPGEIGEFVVSAPWQASGYWGNEDATRETFTVEGVRSGDLGWAEADGWLHFAGRSKDVIISGGENVFPVEVEGALRSLPWVADAVAYGVPDEVWGERVEAAVVLRSGRPADEAEIRAALRPTIAGYKVPKRVRLVAGIPLTPNNKPDRARLIRDAAGD